LRTTKSAYFVRGSKVRALTLGPTMPLAYFITFTTYGTWLPGSAKGMGSVDRDHSAFGTPFVAPDAQREQSAREAMVQLPYLMIADEREIVCRAIVDLSRELNWSLQAVHVRTTHIHLVISADREPGRLMSDLKARASRHLTAAGFDDADRRRWTRHGSTRHLFDDAEVAAAIRYTPDGQGERMACYDGGATKEPRTK
jgi:REP element-mobilizing transposase RayT